MIPAGRNIYIIAKGVFQNTITFAIFRNLEGFCLCQSYFFIFNRDHVDEILPERWGKVSCWQPILSLTLGHFSFSWIRLVLTAPLSGKSSLLGQREEPTLRTQGLRLKKRGRLMKKIHYVNINGMVYQMKENGYFFMNFQNNNCMLLLRSALMLVLYVKW